MKKLRFIECYDGSINIFRGKEDFILHLTEKDIKEILQIGNENV